MCVFTLRARLCMCVCVKKNNWHNTRRKTKLKYHFFLGDTDIRRVKRDIPGDTFGQVQKLFELVKKKNDCGNKRDLIRKIDDGLKEYCSRFREKELYDSCHNILERFTFSLEQSS